MGFNNRFYRIFVPAPGAWRTESLFARENRGPRHPETGFAKCESGIDADHRMYIHLAIPCFFVHSGNEVGRGAATIPMRNAAHSDRYVERANPRPCERSGRSFAVAKRRKHVDPSATREKDLAKPSKKKKKRKSKKDSQLVLRLNGELRNRFVEACQDLDTTAAREVRRFIKRFLKRYERGDFDE